MKIRWENQTKIILCSRNVFIRKTSFSIKVNVRRPHVLSSRMRVVEDSPKKRKSEMIKKHLEKTSNNMYRKRDPNSMDKPLKSYPKIMYI